MRAFFVDFYEDYRYGFNGMEKDDELKGSGNSYTTEFRQYDPRLGRWMSRDKITHPNLSPYAWVTNNPMVYIDPLGLDSAQRTKIVAKSQEFVDKNPTKDKNQYKHINEDTPQKAASGVGADCSGLVETCAIAGNTSAGRWLDGGIDPRTGNYSGVYNMEGFNEAFELDPSDVQTGNIVTMYFDELSWKYHVGIITEVLKDEDGNILSLTINHSSGSKGPNKYTFTPNDESTLYGRAQLKYYKIDHIPDNEPRLKNKNFSDIQREMLNYTYMSMKEAEYNRDKSNLKMTKDFWQEEVDFYNTEINRLLDSNF